MGATVVVIASAGFLFDVPLAGNAIPARAASGKIEEIKSFLTAAFAGFSNGNHRGLNIIEGLFGNHGDMRPLVHFSLVNKNTVVKWIAKNVADGGEWQRFLAAFTDQPH